MDKFQNDSLSAFQQNAIQSITRVLKEHDIAYDGFHVKAGKPASAWAEFRLGDSAHVVAVFERELNMREGPNLFECYLRWEFESQEILIASFAERLRCYLSEGDWRQPSEK